MCNTHQCCIELGITDVRWLEQIFVGALESDCMRQMARSEGYT